MTSDPVLPVLPASTQRPELIFEYASLDDIPALVKLWYDVFDDPAIRAIWPDTPGVRQWWESTIRYDMLYKPAERYLKVVDTAQDGALAGWAKWSFQTAERRGARYLSWHEDMDKSRNDAYFFELEEMRERLVGGGRENYYGDMMAILPQYRKLGLAYLIMDWGCRKADEDNVPLYLDATEVGSRLYKKLGFMPRGEAAALMSMTREPRQKSASEHAMI